MSLKKIFILMGVALAVAVTGLAFAGSAIYKSANQANTPTTAIYEPAITPVGDIGDTAMYFEANVGYMRMNYSDLFGPAVALNSNGRGGFVFGADIGYQFTHYFGLELGGYFPQVVNGSVAAGGRVSLKTWLAYLAAKLSVPICRSFDVFFKGGLNYRSLRVSGNGIGRVFRARSVQPMFGVGAEYRISRNWLVNAQYLYFATSPTVVPVLGAAGSLGLHAFTFGVGYRLTV